ncbi:MAG: hypothetical protein HOG15_00270 [Anaerolineae bacterium]|jgi:predicted small secreted protein|nr:hypothetical protein [Anaerolineae bacterium]MBT4308812.1 hypothetical protein [Anaerolineae bacterium]
MKKLVFILVTLSFLLAACGGTAEETPPPLTGNDVQATAISMAWTMAAETMAAIPTSTFTAVPPTATYTPVFTATPIFSPTPLFTSTPLATATTDKDRCDQVLSGIAAATAKLRIVNQTTNSVSVSLYLAPNNAENQCGYIPVYGTPLSKNAETSVQVPYPGGYTYYVFAWASGDTNFSLSGGPFTINNPDKWEIYIRDNLIKFVGP